METKLLKILLTGISFSGIVFISGCGCPDLMTEATVEPRVREASITRFEPGFDKGQNLPVPQYSIHTFAFPANISSSGSLPNDFRISEGKEIVLAKKEFQAGPDLFTAILSTQYPTNDTLTGDIMVVSVDRINRRACIRFAGELAAISKGFTSGSAPDFANFLKTLINPPPGQVPSWETAATPFGATSPGVSRCGASSQTIIKTIDRQGNDVTALHPVPASIVAELLAQRVAKSVEIEVTIGDIYYYKARNGIEFAVLIEDVFEGSLLPNLQRITIKFTEIKGPSCS